MFPNSTGVNLNNETKSSNGTKSYLFDFDSGDFVVRDGKLIECDGIDAIKVWIEKILRTEKTRYSIYAETEYGCHLEDLIIGILQNEKYVGDLLLQKTFVVDHISKRKAVNKGELPQYYIENNHTAIIDRDIFQKVQEEIKRRTKKYTRKSAPQQPYEFTSKIKCEQCGKNYRRKVLSSGKVVWICSTFNRLGKAYCPSQQIPEDILKRVIGDTEFCEIRIPCHNTINIIQNDGTVITKHWENPSRSESWTPQMREMARERSKNG